MQHITKLCADSLRNYSDNNGIKLKASHAHELVAAFFGYKSKAALLADTSHPLSNLRHASIIVLLPTGSINERRNKLQDLSVDLPDTYTMTEFVYTGLHTEKWILSKVWPSYEALAQFLADEYLRDRQMEGIYRNPVGEGIKVEDEVDYKRLIVKRFYQMPTENSLFSGAVMVYESYITTTILLKRIAGHIGYANPEVSIQIDELN